MVDGVRNAGVLGHALVGEVDFAVFVDGDVLEESVASDCVVDVGLRVFVEVDDLGIATAFVVEDAVVIPAVFVVADEETLGVGREGGLTGAREAEEDGGVLTFLVGVGRAVHRSDAAEGVVVVEIEGVVYELATNNGPNALHGGPTGFQHKNWETEVMDDGVRFTYRSADGEENYPGNLIAIAEYRWNNENQLTLDLKAETDAPTVVNLTNHAYWNLEGADAGSILDHEMKIEAEGWLLTDETQIPTGEIAPVLNTPMDFREFKKIGKDIKADFEALKIGKGYDHCWVVKGWEEGKLQDVVTLKDTKSGRTMVVSSNQPGVQVYTGNWLAGSPKNHSGRSYEDYEGVAIEMQGFPDAPNKPQFPSQLLKPGETYSRTIRFSFM